LKCSDDPRTGPAQEFDFDTDEEDDKSPLSLMQEAEPNERTTADDSDNSSDDETGHTTMANMEARSRALDAKANAEAELDVEEFQEGAAFDEDGDDIDVDMVDGDGDVSAEPFHLPTASEREAEKQSGGPDLHVVQRRMKACVRVLGKFKRLAEKGR
jgi:ribosomal RNA methyltransferase Nop2